MNAQEINITDSQPQVDAKLSREQPARHPWVMPTFERLNLKEAMSTSPKTSAYDGSANYS